MQPGLTKSRKRRILLTTLFFRDVISSAESIWYYAEVWLISASGCGCDYDASHRCGSTIWHATRPCHILQLIVTNGASVHAHHYYYYHVYCRYKIITNRIYI